MSRVGRAVLLALLLGLHLLTRIEAHSSIPLGERHFYPTSYLVSLSLVSGHGFSYLVPRGAVVVPVSNTGPGARGDGLLATSRVLEIHVAAWLWRLFGIGWPTLFVFYALVSTIANLCVFLIARRLGGSFWAGAIASLGFLASPLSAARPPGRSATRARSGSRRSATTCCSGSSAHRGTWRRPARAGQRSASSAWWGWVGAPTSSCSPCSA